MVREIETGFYILKDEDTPWSVANEVYGDGTQYPKLTEINSKWLPGCKIYTPDVKGLAYVVEEGDDCFTILERIGKSPNTYTLYQLAIYNGGADRVYMKGEEAFFPD